MNDRDTYEERMKEMDELFEEWWEDEEAESAIEARQDEAGFPYPPDHFLVSRDAAYNIWCIAYRAGGHRPWMSMSTTEMALFKKLIMGKPDDNSTAMPSPDDLPRSTR
jgi:hypothetical protein